MYHLGDIVKRGCVRSLVAGEIQMCRNEGQFCKTCNENNCNQKQDFQSCYTCNSEQDVNCIANAVATFEPKLCSKYTDTCKTFVIEGGRTERGCTAEITALSTIFSECSGTTCNGAVYPINRKQCHQCTGPDCSRQLFPEDLTLQYCNNYSTQDECYSYYNGMAKLSPKLILF